MAQVLGRFIFKKLAKYPHMKPADIEIWERFVETNWGFFDRVDYDFCVGEGTDFLPTDEDTPDGRQNRLYKRKIDVVGYKGNAVWLIEVKPLADTEALGQIITYGDLYVKEKDVPKAMTLMVLAEKIMTEMKDVYKKKGIEVRIV